MKHFITYTLIASILIGFVALGATRIRSQNIKLKSHQLELKSSEAKLIELNIRYDNLLEKKATTEQEKQQQLEQIKQLESEREELKRQLQVKADKVQKEQERLADASKRVTGTNTAHAQEKPRQQAVNGCESVRQAMASRGFSGIELDSAVELARLESGCNSRAVNKSSGACNIYQELRCGKWGGLSNTDAHLDGAVVYMKGRYGTWSNALSTWHSRSPHWW